MDFWGFFCFLLLAVPSGMQDLSSLTRDQTLAPTVEVWSPNHWTEQEIPN